MAPRYLTLLRPVGLLRRMGDLRTARCLTTVHGDLDTLSSKVRAFVERNAELCEPENVHIVDGSEAEQSSLLHQLQAAGTVRPLKKYHNCWLTRTDPRDVARVESRTVISTPERRDTVPDAAPGVQGALGKWMSPGDMQSAVQARFPGCMRGRTMYVLPYSMGPTGGPLSKIGVQLTDSAYVVASMGVMTRTGAPVAEALGDGEFVQCLHSVGQPLPLAEGVDPAWPCNPEQTLIAHIPDNNQIISFGSGYGGNSLLGKKCFALRLGSILARREGWLAEHMLILGITNPAGVKRYIAAAFPSACGKTNLAMMTPSLPGYKVECVGDDIAWMRFDEEGVLRAINPEAGFFGVAPGTSTHTNPNAMDTIRENTFFTNVAETSDGGVFWEGLEDEVSLDGLGVTDWLGKAWTPGSGTKAAHPNSRFCTPAAQCPIMDPAWEDPRGVPISAVLFGGRRPQGVPLVYEAFSWQHGVFVGASMRSEATAAAEHGGKAVMHDPFAMRPFFGYNFGHYLQHWLDLGARPGAQLPRVFHVNWFRKDPRSGKFLWPGFGENARVLDWVLRRVDGSAPAVPSPVGLLPTEGAAGVDTAGLAEPVDMQELFDLPKDFWQAEVEAVQRYFQEQVGDDLPDAVQQQLDLLRQRVHAMDGEESEGELSEEERSLASR